MRVRTIAGLFLFMAASAQASTLPRFDCAARRGDYDKRELPAVDGGFALSGTVRTDWYKPDPFHGARFLPVATVAAWNAGQTAAVYVQILLEVGDKYPTLLIKRTGGEQKMHVRAGTVQVGTDVPFSFTADGAGAIAVKFGKKSLNLQLGGPVASLVLSCSSGNFDFNNLELEKRN